MADEPTIGIWRGPFEGQTADGHTVAYGDTAYVTEADLESGHWDTSRKQSLPEDPLPEPTPVFPETPVEETP